MSWRKSLVVTAIVVGLELALGQLQLVVYTFVFTSSPQIVNATPGNVAIFAAVLSLARLLIFAVITFFVIVWGLRSYSDSLWLASQLRARDVLDMLDEEQVQELKQLLIAPSRRAE